MVGLAKESGVYSFSFFLMCCACVHLSAKQTAVGFDLPILYIPAVGGCSTSRVKIAQLGEALFDMESKSESIDLNPLMRLKDALEGAQKNTAKMLQKLERFENRLTDLDEKMKPIQTTTKHYTRAKENISLTLVEVLKTCEYFKIPAQVKEVVNLGFTPETQEEFFEALGKLTNAKRYFEAHPEIKSSASMLSNIDGLLAVSSWWQSACVCSFHFGTLSDNVGCGGSVRLRVREAYAIGRSKYRCERRSIYGEWPEAMRFLTTRGSI